MKILFLDIDGVLNSTRTAVAFNGYGHDTSPKGLSKFDMVAVGLIRTLCKETDTKIVLSSSWRIGRSLDQVVKMGEDLDLPIIGMTRNLNYGVRGNEIAMWVADYFDAIEKYAIVDDDDDMTDEQWAHFVQTDHHEGLSWQNYKALKTILGESHE